MGLKKIFIILLLVSCFVGVYLWGQKQGSEVTVELQGIGIPVEVADSEAERVRGLGGRDSLFLNQGMLFVFDEPDYHGITMRDMRFAIDIIWLDSNKRIVDIEQNIKPETFPQVFKPRQQALYVLEIASGFAERYGLEIGQTAEFDL